MNLPGNYSRVRAVALLRGTVLPIGDVWNEHIVEPYRRTSPRLRGEHLHTFVLKPSPTSLDAPILSLLMAFSAWTRSLPLRNSKNSTASEANPSRMTNG
jgi:hypothetical protein